MIKSMAKSMLATVLAAGLVVGLPSPAAADLISTSEALAFEEGGANRAVVDAWLERADIVEELSSLGVDPEMARLRVAALSTAEVVEMADAIQNAPAGGDGVIAVLGVTFLVLLILELVGVIDIFKKA